MRTADEIRPHERIFGAEYPSKNFIELISAAVAITIARRNTEMALAYSCIDKCF